MEYFYLQLNNLPDEILLAIFKKLNNVELLYSLFDNNKRLNKILYDPIFTSHLNLLKFGWNNSIYRLPHAVLDRFCLQILPKIRHKIKWLNLESSSMARILLSTNYPKLYRLGLYNLEIEKAKQLFTDETLLSDTFKSQILSLTIRMSKNDKRNLTVIFTHIFTMFTNLQYLNLTPSPRCYQELSFDISPPSIFSSNLLEFHVKLNKFTDCLYLLDGRFSQLRRVHVNISIITSSSLVINNEEKLPNIVCFSLNCDTVTNVYDELIVPLLRRLSNLEELGLNLPIIGRKAFVDGNNLKDIIDHMPQLNKLTFNIHSTIPLDNQINLPSNENIENTFKSFKYNQTISCVDYFSEAVESQCHIYSYPYTLKEYKNITNNFPGGLFKYVRRIELFDEQPFEHDFFLRIAQSFPSMEQLTLVNQKAQKNKQCRISPDNDQHVSIIKYSHLNDLNLLDAHDDYIEQFLIDTKTCLPNNVLLLTNHRQLEKVTHNFERDATRINCSKINYVYCSTISSLPKHFNSYFLHTRVII